MAEGSVLPPLKEAEILAAVANVVPETGDLPSVLPTLEGMPLRRSQLAILAALLVRKCSTNLLVDFLDLMIRGTGSPQALPEGTTPSTVLCATIEGAPAETLEHLGLLATEDRHSARMTQLLNAVLPLAKDNTPATVLAGALDFALQVHLHRPPTSA